MAFLYKYSTLNYEKQERKLCLVLAVLASLLETGEGRGWNTGHSNRARRRCLGKTHVEIWVWLDITPWISFQKGGPGRLKMCCYQMMCHTFPKRQ